MAEKEANKVEKEPVKYDRLEFELWFRRLLNADYSCFFREILRVQKKNLWEEYKNQADRFF